MGPPCALPSCRPRSRHPQCKAGQEGAAASTHREARRERLHHERRVRGLDALLRRLILALDLPQPLAVRALHRGAVGAAGQAQHLLLWGGAANQEGSGASAAGGGGGYRLAAAAAVRLGRPQSWRIGAAWLLGDMHMAWHERGRAQGACSARQQRAGWPAARRARLVGVVRSRRCAHSHAHGTNWPGCRALQQLQAQRRAADHSRAARLHVSLPERAPPTAARPGQ